MTDSGQNPPPPPMINPFVFPVVLLILGLWCFYDGWLTTDPEMQEHILFNRILAAVLIPWSIWDFIRTRKRLAAEKADERKTAQ